MRVMPWRSRPAFFWRPPFAAYEIRANGGRWRAERIRDIVRQRLRSPLMTCGAMWRSFARWRTAISRNFGRITRKTASAASRSPAEKAWSCAVRDKVGAEGVKSGYSTTFRTSFGARTVIGERPGKPLRLRKRESSVVSGRSFYSRSETEPDGTFSRSRSRWMRLRRMR